MVGYGIHLGPNIDKKKGKHLLTSYCREKAILNNPSPWFRPNLSNSILYFSFHPFRKTWPVLEDLKIDIFRKSSIFAFKTSFKSIWNAFRKCFPKFPVFDPSFFEFSFGFFFSWLSTRAYPNLASKFFFNFGTHPNVFMAKKFPLKLDYSGMNNIFKRSQIDKTPNTIHIRHLEVIIVRKCKIPNFVATKIIEAINLVVLVTFFDTFNTAKLHRIDMAHKLVWLKAPHIRDSRVSIFGTTYINSFSHSLSVLYTQCTFLFVPIHLLQTSILVLAFIWTSSQNCRFQWKKKWCVNCEN